MRALTQPQPDAPVYWDSVAQTWVVTDYEACVFVQTREDIFGTVHSCFPGAEAIRGRHGVQVLDGQLHRQIHAALVAFFTAARLEGLRDSVIRPVVDWQVQRIDRAGKVEIASEFADPLATRIMAGVLGLEWHNDRLISACELWKQSIALWALTEGEDDGVRELAASAAVLWTKEVLPNVESSGENPSDNLLGWLWSSGRAILPEWGALDVLDQCRLLFLAGGDGVARLVCTVWYVLMMEPRLRRRVQQEPRNLLPHLVDEVLRLVPPAQLRPRVALREVELGGHRIKSGERVHARLELANQDPAQYREADRIDVDRPQPTRHLSFNVGPRYCAGAPLAHAEAVEAAAALLAVLRNARLDPEQDRPELTGYLFRGFRPLHTIFEPVVRSKS